ncbi:hypothetical protein [Paraburkholderia sp. JHI869]|uniref:hypothetical protein n=1 Tax=Paraburkholderia sp. JHI869 TaxID=3112959 RepID=UPI00317D46F3
MALTGSAFLALWNDVDTDVEADYERWHTSEHVPERVGIPGFLAGRRYRSGSPGQPRYFTLYEVADVTVFDSVAYRDVIDRPTPWSAAMRPRLRNVVRATCETAASTGNAAGEKEKPPVALACARFSCSQDAQPHSDSLLAACAALQGVRGVHLGAARSSVPSAFKQWSKTANPTHVLLIEGDAEAALCSAHAAIAVAIDAHGHAREPATINTYTLTFRIGHEQVDASLLRAPVHDCAPVASLPFDPTSGHT